MIINPSRKDIITLFMSEAKKKHDIRRGFNPILQDAVGLVEVCVAFEAFIDELLHVRFISQKRNNFSLKYQYCFENHKTCLIQEIEVLQTELQNQPLEDMTANTTKGPINITNINNLGEVIEVIYRVRSNLIHGSKNLYSERNKILITNSFNFLYTFLEIIFNEEGII